jgi:hypothetical protein
MLLFKGGTHLLLPEKAAEQELVQVPPNMTKIQKLFSQNPVENILWRSKIEKKNRT